MNFDREALRDQIMEEVAKQLIPFKAHLDSLDKWKNEVFGNDSGFQGYLEKARAEDKRYQSELRASIEKITPFIAEKERDKMEAEIRKRIAEESESRSVKRLNRFKLIAEILSVPAVAAAFNWLAHHHF